MTTFQNNDFADNFDDFDIRENYDWAASGIQEAILADFHSSKASIAQAAPALPVFTTSSTPALRLNHPHNLD